MLSKLTIQNYALIQSLEMNPANGLNIITGETGAGKSIMLGAVGLLLGKRADTKVLLDLDKKCIIEGIFNISDYKLKSLFIDEDLDYEIETSIRREITPSGKSRAFINDTPVTLDVLKKLGQYLMDVHSQHETLQLGASNYQLNIIDAFAGTKEKAKAYLAIYTNYKEKEKLYQQLISEGDSLKKDADYNAFLLNELAQLSLEEHEQEPLEEELKVLENAEEIKQRLHEAIQALTNAEFGALERLQTVQALLKQLSGFSTHYDKLDKQFEQAYIELKELSRDIESEEGQVEVNFEKTEQVQQRLSSIYQLQKKHQVASIKDLLAIKSALEEKSFASGNLEEALEKAKVTAETAEKKAIESAQQLSKQRLNSTALFSQTIKMLLATLGMPDATITINAETKPLSANGIDEITLMFSANKGVTPQSLKQVASGGEFSRLMFCIKYLLADKTALPTIVFDEIDTGISGEIALKMGTMMRKMALNHQVIAISHLPQIAAKGDAHYYVYKDNTTDRAISSIRELTPKQSTKAIAQMIGGNSPSESAYASARELMEL